MSDAPSLFGDEDEAVAPAPAPLVEKRAAEWQVEHLRNALDARGLRDMTERQRLIEEAVGRSLASLRELTFTEAMAALDKLGQSAPAAPGTAASSWDERGGDTWIDRL